MIEVAAHARVTLGQFFDVWGQPLSQRRVAGFGAARYLAISSKKSMWALKKKDSLGANSSTSRPRSMARST